MDKYWIWFSRLNKIGAKTQNELLEKYKTPKNIWFLTIEELKKDKILTQTQIDIILDKTYRNDLDKHINYLEKHNIKIITLKDKEYPKKLLNIYDPPTMLYVKGNINILNEKSIGIVGSRNCSEYGIKTTKQLAYNISKNNINIISGLAQGIDTYAHIATIAANKKTIAVVGTGLDTVYPKENKNICNEIIEKGGAIITEYSLGTKPEKLNFPARNRIISGLSDGILVVEASKKSGALITVDFALEQGKNIYCVPR